MNIRETYNKSKLAKEKESLKTLKAKILQLTEEEGFKALEASLPILLKEMMIQEQTISLQQQEKTGGKMREKLITLLIKTDHLLLSETIKFLNEQKTTHTSTLSLNMNSSKIQFESSQRLKREKEHFDQESVIEEIN